MSRSATPASGTGWATLFTSGTGLVGTALTILVTHDVTEAVALADRVLVIEDGRIALDLPVDLPRPRRRGSHQIAALEARILQQLFDKADVEDAI